MRVNLEWLREWVELRDADSVAADLTTSGLEVDAIEPLAATDSNIVVGEVVEVARHPNADRLSVCVVDDGAGRHQVVCGAPNVAAGIKAPFARPGEGLVVGETPTVSEERVLDLLRGADVVAYDTMFSLEEYLERMTWGHSYPEYALALCEAAGVGELVLFHHRPEASDEELDRQEIAWAARPGPVKVTMAKEGRVVDCAASRAWTRGRAAVNAEG